MPPNLSEDFSNLSNLKPYKGSSHIVLGDGTSLSFPLPMLALLALLPLVVICLFKMSVLSLA